MVKRRDEQWRSRGSAPEDLRDEAAKIVLHRQPLLVAKQPVDIADKAIDSVLELVISRYNSTRLSTST